MPQLAVFPKAFMTGLCVDGSVSLHRWIEMAAELDVNGLEFYAGFRELPGPEAAPAWRRRAADQGLQIPMFCCSPDFTHPDPAFRAEQVAHEKRWIDTAAALGARYCRVLSGQRRPQVSREQGVELAAACIEACLDHAAAAGVVLVLENHYKDDYWTHPEFAQKLEVFCDLVERIDSPHFGVNFDPSNTLLAGEEPLELLRRVRHRVRTMHASDRYLAEGTLEDLRREENSAGYAARLRHGEIGRGLNDYDAIFRELRGAGFDGWISIEDGVEGMQQLHRSVAFLRRKMAEHWSGDPAAEQRP